MLPGGLARVSPDQESLDQTPTSGRLGQDCWVIGDDPVDTEITLLPPANAAIRLTRSGRIAQPRGRNPVLAGTYVSGPNRFAFDTHDLDALGRRV